LASASDIRYYSIPQRQKELAELEAKEAEKNADGKSGGVVTPEAIAEVVARWTGVPVTALVSSEKAKLLKLEKTLTRSIVGQPTAIKAVSNAIRLSRSGLNDQNRPIFSALLTGPSGSGKTSLAKTLAKAMFNDENAMIRIDCSELSAEHSISRLIGSPQGYVGMQQGGQLTEAVRRKPYQIVLFDEIEKGHAALYKLLLSVLDAGVLTSAVGLKVDFRNSESRQTRLVVSEHKLTMSFYLQPSSCSRPIWEAQHWQKTPRKANPRTKPRKRSMCRCRRISLPSSWVE
jgi:ATP-dependent Clp protease ATP-binding subunit ClpB